MVISFVVYHVYHFPVNVVIKTYLDKHLLNKDSEDVIDMKEVENRPEADSMEYLRRTFTSRSIFPKLLRKLPFMEDNAIAIEEEFWLDYSEHRHWFRSRNITYSEYLNIWNSSSTVPDPGNPEWTRLEQYGVIEWTMFGQFGYAMEMILKKFVERKMKKDIHIMEDLLKTEAWKYIEPAQGSEPIRI